MQTQKFIVHGITVSEGVFTPTEGFNAGKEVAFDNLKFLCSVPLEQENSLGMKEITHVLKKGGLTNFARFKNVELPAEGTFHFELDFSKRNPIPKLINVTF